MITPCGGISLDKLAAKRLDDLSLSLAHLPPRELEAIWRKALQAELAPFFPAYKRRAEELKREYDEWNAGGSA
jgi:hypothetical protein